jgi:hypothetical protein
MNAPIYYLKQPFLNVCFAVFSEEEASQVIDFYGNDNVFVLYGEEVENEHIINWRQTHEITR